MLLCVVGSLFNHGIQKGKINIYSQKPSVKRIVIPELCGGPLSDPQMPIPGFLPHFQKNPDPLNDCANVNISLNSRAKTQKPVTATQDSQRKEPLNLGI